MESGTRRESGDHSDICNVASENSSDRNRTPKYQLEQQTKAHYPLLALLRAASLADTSSSDKGI